MTLLEEVEALPKEVLTCDQVSRVLSMNPGYLHKMAIEHPEQLGFPVIVTGSYVRIPKAAFLLFMKEGRIECR